MTWLDRFIQNWRIRVAKPFISKNARVLDIGSADGALFRELRHLQNGVGIDPESAVGNISNAKLIRGVFPADLSDPGPFDAITILAVLEHIPPEAQPDLARNCFNYLRTGGRVIITVPSPQTDYVLHVLRFLRLIHGMSLEQHYGYDVTRTVSLFSSVGFQKLCARPFQLGLNNLFVFEKLHRSEN